MIDEPKPQDEAESERRFNEALKRLANTPHKPHKTKEGREPKPAPKAS